MDDEKVRREVERKWRGRHELKDIRREILGNNGNNNLALGPKLPYPFLLF